MSNPFFRRQPRPGASWQPPNDCDLETQQRQKILKAGYEGIRKEDSGEWTHIEDGEIKEVPRSVWFGLILLPLILLGGCFMEVPGDSYRQPTVPPIPLAPPVGVGVDRMPMLEDPEAEIEESAVDTWAKDEYEARRNCEATAQNWMNQGGGLVTVQVVRQTSKTPTNNGNYRFTCTLRSEP